MAIPTDSSFGSGFDADGFRTAIRNAMMMGLPNTVAERATFQWNPDRHYTTKDTSGSPYDWTETPVTADIKPDVQVVCAVEFLPRATKDETNAMGEINSPKAIITVLDVDYSSIHGADTVLLGHNTYMIDYVGPPVGLFDVTVYTLYASAEDET